MNRHEEAIAQLESLISGLKRSLEYEHGEALVTRGWIEHDAALGRVPYPAHRVRNEAATKKAKEYAAKIAALTVSVDVLKGDTE